MQPNGSSSRDSPETQPPPGVVELREDVPLKAGGAGAGAGAAGEGGRWCAGGPRFITACFALLTVATTLALLTQIYSGDYQVVPHGGASTGAAECSSAGTDALKRGGRALDAAAAAALCLAVLNPHRTSLDASGAMVYWEYRQVRTMASAPETVEWGGPVASAASTANETDEAKEAKGAKEANVAPRLVAALAALHARHGVLPWRDLLQPAIDLARDGFLVSGGLASALAAEANGSASPAAGTLSTAPHIADYLQSLQHNTSAELSASWGSEGWLRRGAGAVGAAGEWRLVAAGAGAAPALNAMRAALRPPPASPEDASRRVISALQGEAASAAWPPASVAAGLAVVDQFDTYVALVTGLSRPFGSEASALGAVGAWTGDRPTAPLDLAAAVLTQEQVCGARLVAGAESAAALAQAAAALAAGAGAPDADAAAVAAVEAPRVALAGGGALLAEARRPPPVAAALPPLSLSPPPAAALAPYAAVNVVLQRGDALLSHADSRGGGLASRF